MGDIWKKIVAVWDSIPHYIQAPIVLFAGAAGGVLIPVIYNWANGQTVCTVTAWPCIEGYLKEALKTGIAAVFGLYIKSSIHKPVNPGQ